MKLNVNDRMISLLGEGLSGRAVPLMDGYVYDAILRRVAATIRSRLIVQSSPQYNGEAEIYFLRPIMAAAGHLAKSDDQYATTEAEFGLTGEGGITRYFVLTSLSYSLLAEYFALTQAKDVAKDLASEAILNSTLYNAFKDAYYAANDDLTADEKLKDAAASWSRMRTYADGSNIITDKDKNVLSVDGKPAASVLATARNYFSLTPISAADTEKTKMSFIMKTCFKDMLQNVRTGKRMPLSNTMKVKRYEQLISVADAIEAAQSSASHAKKMDAITLGVALLDYLQIVEDYDSYMPSAPFQSLSTGWGLSLRSLATRLASQFSDWAAIAPYTVLNIALKLWDAEYDIKRPILPDSSAHRDMVGLRKDIAATIDKTGVPIMADLVESAFNNFKNYMEATAILPPIWTTKFKDIIEGAVFSAEPTPDELIKGAGALTVFSSIKKTSYTVAMTELAGQLQDIKTSVDASTRSRALLSLSFDEAAFRNSLFNTQMSDLIDMPIKGSIRNPLPIGFTVADPIEINYPKYKVDYSNGVRTNSLTAEDPWIFKSKLFKPIRPAILHIETAKQYAKQYDMVWVGFKELPILDPVSKMFATGLVPRIYTRSRSKSRMALSMDAAYLKLTALDSGNAIRDRFETIADILNRESSYLPSLASALIGTFMIYAKGASDRTWTWQWDPTGVPTVWGAPLAEFASANNAATKALLPTDELVIPSSYKGKLTMSDEHMGTLKAQDRAYMVDLPGGVSYAFVMNQLFPFPESMAVMPWSPSKGVTLMIPVAKTAYDIAQESLSKGGTLSSIVSNMVRPAVTVGTTYAIETHYSEFTLTLPHILFTIVNKTGEFADEQWTRLAEFSIAMKVDPITGDLIFRGLANADTEIWDESDYRKAIDAPDPEPTQDVVLTRQESQDDTYHLASTPPTQPTSSVEINPTNPAPTGGGSNPAPNLPPVLRDVTTTDSSGQVTTSLEVTNAAEPVTPSALKPTKLTSPMGGDPSVVETSTEPPTAKMKKYKLSDKAKAAGIEGPDEIEIMEGQPVPSGYVPA